MTTVTIRDLRLNSSAVWERLREDGEMVLTSNGKPIAVMSSVDDLSAEEAVAAFRRARAQTALTRMRQGAVAAGTSGMTTQQIDAEIAAVRAVRRA